MVILLHILQEAAFTCRYLVLVVTEMKTWICRTIRMKMVDIRQEAVRRDRDLAMGRLRTSQPFRWSTMKSRLLLEVLLMLLGLRRNMQIRTRCLVRLCRGRHHLHRLFLFLFLLILIFRFLKASPRNVSQTRARGQHPDDTSKAKSRTVVGPPRRCFDPFAGVF